ncbi:Fic family protein [Kocuria sp. CPCC 205315]
MQDINFPEVPFHHNIVSDIIELERVRADLRGENLFVPVAIELRRLFQSLTSMMSARIEGNRTTVAQAILEADSVEEHGGRASDAVQEILQLDEATRYIDDLADQDHLHLTHTFIRELHALSLQGLEREGDRNPGSYRPHDVEITGSAHRPPGAASVAADMDQLLDFATKEVPPQQQLLQTAIVHHRFVWIHPFSNGNGRVARLLTYAMLIQQGYTSSSGIRALNPTAVFGADRQAYYNHLALADSLRPGDVLDWCCYVVHGLREDLAAVHRLSDPHAVLHEVYRPALDSAVAERTLSESQAQVLFEVIQKGVCKAGDLEHVLPGSSSNRSHKLSALVDAKYLRRVENRRLYTVRLVPNPLTIHVVRRLDELGLLPAILRD